MPNVATNLKRIFGKPALSSSPPFKQYHYLNLLEANDLGQILGFCERKRFFELLGDMADKRLFLVSHPAVGYLPYKVAELKPQQLLNYEIEMNGTKGEGGTAPVKGTIRGDLKPLAVKSGMFDWVLAPMATLVREDFSSYCGELSRVLAQGGRMVVSLIHPLLEIFLLNQNPASSARARNNLEHTLRLMREHDLFLETVLEGVIDKETRPYFVTREGISHYEEFAGLPLVLFMRAVKFTK